MEAPDKIYIQPNAHDGWFEGEKPSDIFEEYIRKDALLEWAKDWQDELDDSLGASMVYHVLNEVIKKIESL
jgi:hypothetical protein